MNSVRSPSPDLVALASAGLLPADAVTYGKLVAGGWAFDAALYVRAESDRLIVALPSARSSVGYAPEYLRLRWVHQLPGFSLISIEDPTCLLAPMNGGWFLGREDSYALESLSNAVTILAGALGIDLRRVLFYGSSAGGLSALQLAALCEGACAIAEIPSLDLSRTFWPSAVTRALRPGYRSQSVHQVMQRMPERVSALHMFEKTSRVPNHLVLHCARDLMNQSEVYRYLAQLPETASRCRFSGLMMFEAHLYGTGHAALPLSAASNRIVHFTKMAFLA